MNNREIINITKKLPLKSESKAYLLHSIIIDNNIVFKKKSLHKLLELLECKKLRINGTDKYIFEFDDGSYFLVENNKYRVGYFTYYGLNGYNIIKESMKGYSLNERIKQLMGKI